VVIVPPPLPSHGACRPRSHRQGDQYQRRDHLQPIYSCVSESDYTNYAKRAYRELLLALVRKIVPARNMPFVSIDKIRCKHCLRNAPVLLLLLVVDLNSLVWRLDGLLWLISALALLRLTVARLSLLRLTIASSSLLLALSLTVTAALLLLVLAIASLLLLTLTIASLLLLALAISSLTALLSRRRRVPLVRGLLVMIATCALLVLVLVVVVAVSVRNKTPERWRPESRRMTGQPRIRVRCASPTGSRTCPVSSRLANGEAG